MNEAEFSIQTPTDNVLTLDQAVLLYHGRSGGALATVHEVMNVDGAPVIGAGCAMTAQAARELAGSNELIPAVSKLAARLMQELTATLRVGDSEVVIAAAAGIALGDARYIGIESMFEAARRAATQAVELGSGHCEFADE